MRARSWRIPCSPRRWRWCRTSARAAAPCSRAPAFWARFLSRKHAALAAGEVLAGLPCLRISASTLGMIFELVVHERVGGREIGGARVAAQVGLAARGEQVLQHRGPLVVPAAARPGRRRSSPAHGACGLVSTGGRQRQPRVEAPWIFEVVADHAGDLVDGLLARPP